MFQLSAEEFANWKSQIVTSKPAVKMGARRRPYAFTEQGVAMLSSVLRSERAVAVNIEIMRAFVRLRRLLASRPVSGCGSKWIPHGHPKPGILIVAQGEK